MNKLYDITPIYVERLPQALEHGVIYISKEYKCSVHLCPCGCGQKVYVPIDEQGWTLTEESGTITLSPSIGNFELPCESHYFIRKNKIVWV